VKEKDKNGFYKKKQVRMKHEISNTNYHNDKRLYTSLSKIFSDSNHFKMKVFEQYVSWVGIETHSFCNRKCAFCQNSYIDRHSATIYMPEQMYSKIINELALINYKGLICYSGYNEPLAHRVILYKLREAREKLPNAILFTSTNGDFVTREYLDELAYAGMNRMRIMRYPLLDEEYSTDKQMQVLIEFAHKLKLKYEKVNSSRLRLLHPELYLEVISEDLKKMVNNRAGSVDLFRNEQGVTLRKEPCRAPFTECYVRYDGSVNPCCATRPDVVEQKDMIMGNVSSETLFDIYTSFKWSLLRYQMKDYGEQKVFPCSVCNDYTRQF